VKAEFIKERILVVGGHSRKIGKTSLIVDLIRAFPGAGWTAVKITYHSHAPLAGTAIKSAGDHSQPAVALHEERDRFNRTDTSRFLAAGAARAFLLQVEHGRMEEGLALLGAELEMPGNVIVESNTALQFLKPLLYLVVLDPSREDFKSSVQSTLRQVDAFVLRSPLGTSPWPELPEGVLEAKPKFLQRMDDAFPAELRDFVQEKFFSSSNAE
jgi:molybdopterin-guanine dinucleotide biosynthesis protein